MKKNKIKNSDLQLSRLIYGCMKLSNWDKNPVTESEIRKAEGLVNCSLENGINTFDHADIYCLGKAEKVFGKILKNSPSIRENIIIQSKCGIRMKGNPDSESPGRYDFSKDHIIKSTEGILERLNTGYLDILLLHRPDPLMEPEEVAAAFDLLQKSGKVKYFGVSNFTSGQIELLQKSLNQKIIVNQVELNLKHNNLINDGVVADINTGGYSNVSGTLDYCRLNEIHIQAWSPLARGVYSSPPAGAESNILKTSEYINKLASEKQSSPEAVVLSWLLKHPAEIMPVLGTSNIKRLKLCLLAEKVELSREEWYQLFILARGKILP